MLDLLAPCQTVLNGLLGGSVERERIQIKVDLPRCPFCHDDVLADQPKRGCEACFAWHHAECWGEGGERCSACGVAPEGATPVAPAAPEQRERRRGRRWIHRWRALAAQGRSDPDPDLVRAGQIGTPVPGRRLSPRDHAALRVATAGLVAALITLGWAREHLGVLPTVVLLSLIGLVVVFLVIAPGNAARLWRAKRNKRRKGKRAPRGKGEPLAKEDLPAKAPDEPPKDDASPGAQSARP
ncbi:MAG: hypothetical protein KDD82_01585 [Planctomycetes bacterium]|nr:hypothetical protein [Planctomycetota bacterium]